MTDNEIIKALECCMKGNNCGGCCPYDDEDDTCEECTSKLTKDALDLINRQKAEIKEKDEMLSAQADIIRTLERVLEDKTAEIERLQRKYELSKAEREANVKGFTESIAIVKSEAIKEFAERAKNRLERKYTIYGREYVLRHLRELVKEMTEEGK